MNLLIALTAAQWGAAIANYISVTSVTHGKDGKVCVDACTADR